MLHQLFALPFNLNHASSKKNTSTVSRNPSSTNSWNYCNNCLLLFSIWEKGVLQIWFYISTVVKALLFCELSIMMSHCQQSIGAKISSGFFYLSTITSQFSVTWNLKITYFLPVQQKACHSKFFHYSVHHSSTQNIFFIKNLVTLLRLHMWIKHIWPNMQGANLHCNTRQQCYKNTGFLQYSFWVTGSQRPPIPMLAVSTLSLDTEHCTSELWSSYSLLNLRCSIPKCLWNKRWEKFRQTQQW